MMLACYCFIEISSITGTASRLTHGAYAFACDIVFAPDACWWFHSSHSVCTFHRYCNIQSTQRPFLVQMACASANVFLQAHSLHPLSSWECELRRKRRSIFVQLRLERKKPSCQGMHEHAMQQHSFSEETPKHKQVSPFHTIINATKP